MTPGLQPKAHLIISNTGVLCIGEMGQTESKMLLIKHKWGTPARGEVREFYRQLARHCNSTFCDGAGPVFVLRTPSGKTVMILLGGKVEDMHRALDGIMELLGAAGMVPASPQPDRHFVPPAPKPVAPGPATDPAKSA